MTNYKFTGKGWENHIEGQKLKADGDSFRLKLNTQEIFDDWARNVQQRNLGVNGRIFTVESTRSRTGRGNVMKLKVILIRIRMITLIDLFSTHRPFRR